MTVTVTVFGCHADDRLTTTAAIATIVTIMAIVTTAATIAGTTAIVAMLTRGGRNR